MTFWYLKQDVGVCTTITLVCQSDLLPNRYRIVKRWTSKSTNMLVLIYDSFLLYARMHLVTIILITSFSNHMNCNPASLQLVCKIALQCTMWSTLYISSVTKESELQKINLLHKSGLIPLHIFIFQSITCTWPVNWCQFHKHDCDAFFVWLE